MKEMKLGLVMTIGAMAAANPAQAQVADVEVTIDSPSPVSPAIKYAEVPKDVVTPQPTVESATLPQYAAPLDNPVDHSTKLEVPEVSASSDITTSNTTTSTGTMPRSIANKRVVPPAISVATPVAAPIVPTIATTMTIGAEPQYSVAQTSIAQKDKGDQLEPVTSDSELQRLKTKQDNLQQEMDLLRKRVNQGVQKAVIKPDPDLPSGLQIYSEALFLTPRSSLLTDFAKVNVGPNPAIGGQVASFDYRGSTGWRVGARYRFDKSPWEVGATIMRLGSDSDLTVNRPIGGSLLATLAPPDPTPFAADRAIGTSKIDYTVADLEAGYHVPLTSKIDLKFFGGLRIASLSQSNSAQYFGGRFGALGGGVNTVNDFRGFGPRVGLEARSALGSGFSAYVRGSGSLLFGDQDTSAAVSLNGTPLVDYRVQRKQTIPVVDLAIGLDWSTKIGKAGKFIAGIGYEYQQWFNATSNIRSTGTGMTNFTENRGDLSTQGFFAKAGLSWTF